MSDTESKFTLGMTLRDPPEDDLEVYLGNILRDISHMVKEGYVEGIGQPIGCNWKLVPVEE